ncbi:putative sulfotransferase [Acidocella aquatica]|uniref:Sulfotransferase n=1 Tax=Acidocella aquatica TaxID=1922313 RepID=A0ABQ5ZZY4_9PROT|nr:sulfotransferase [Acidocella aquatica]GLR65769.1 putative sulfotransferase [Acidocella aquatica]
MIPQAKLDLAEIIQSATGGQPGVSPDMLEALRILTGSWNQDGHLTPAGAAGKRAGLIRAITNRLRLEDTLTRHPEIIREPIAGPIVIIGLPRSGTTKLHRIIAAGPGMQKLLLWQLLNPVPLPNTPPNGPDPRIALAEAYTQALRANAPELYAAHPMAANEPDEDIFALEVTGYNYINCSTVPAPAYKAWLDQQSFTPVYRWLKLILQVQQFFGHGRGQPWVLKAPQHMGFLPELFSTFPNATIVHCHRDPKITVASYIAMIAAARRASCTIANAADVGRYALEFWGEHTRRYLAARAVLATNHSFVDLAYNSIVADSLACAERIHAAAGLPLPAASRAAMLAWEQSNTQHKHGKHSYNLADAGLTPDDIARAFAQYTNQFGGYF